MNAMWLSMRHFATLRTHGADFQKTPPMKSKKPPQVKPLAQLPIKVSQSIRQL